MRKVSLSSGLGHSRCRVSTPNNGRGSSLGGLGAGLEERLGALGKFLKLKDSGGTDVVVPIEFFF